jgi:hypothetical protein
VLGEVRGHADDHGGVRSHLLASINTPLALGSLFERARLVQSREFFEALISNSLGEGYRQPPTLDVINVNLTGWRSPSKKPPRCNFEVKNAGGGVVLDVLSGLSEERRQHVCLTRESPGH